jgi:hypothetical protein
MWHYILIGLICLIAGFWLGGRHGRYVKRTAIRELNTNSLDLLESKSKFSGIESKYADYQRKDKLLQLSLEQLKRSNAQAKLSTALAAKSKAQAIKSRNLAVQSHEKAVKATSLARKATAHLKQLENAMTSRQPISASNSASYGVSDPTKLSVIQPSRARYGEKIVKQVSS